MAATASTSASSLVCQSADAMSPMPSILLRKGRKVLRTNRFTRSWRREQNRERGWEGRWQTPAEPLWRFDFAWGGGGFKLAAAAGQQSPKGQGPAEKTRGIW